MDKKKVIELIKEARHLAFLRKCENRQAYLNNCIRCLKEALEELSKSDWISVDERLPEFDEDVWIRSKKSPKNVGTAYRHKECEGGYGSDKYGFPSELEVTHWRKIDKLEE